MLGSEWTVRSKWAKGKWGEWEETIECPQMPEANATSFHKIDTLQEIDNPFVGGKAKVNWASFFVL